MKTVQSCFNDKMHAKVVKFLGDYTERQQMRMRNECGVDALFVPVDDNCGVKFFKKREVGLSSFHTSAVLYHMGYTPKVWDLQTINIDGGEYVCFMMERCKILGEIAQTSPRPSNKSDIFEKIKRIISRLDARLMKLTPYYNDDSHRWNFGFNRAGRIVCIDVGFLKLHNGDYVRGVY